MTVTCTQVWQHGEDHAGTGLRTGQGGRVSYLVHSLFCYPFHVSCSYPQQLVSCWVAIATSPDGGVALYTEQSRSSSSWSEMFVECHTLCLIYIYMYVIGGFITPAFSFILS